MKKELSLLVALLCTAFSFAQTSKSSPWKQNPKEDKTHVVMTWNKNTPETEMNDDVKALSEYGVTIKYANVKRNADKEIIGIDVSFEDKNGNKGSLNYNNSKPISTIKFYKQGDEVGFGEPANSFGSNAFVFSGGDDLMKGFNFNFNDNDNLGHGFNFDMPEPQFNHSESKIIIKKDGKKPLVIKNGEVVEGGDDYTAEEIEEIKKNNTTEHLGYGEIYNFSNNGNGNVAEQMKKMQQQIDKLMQQQGLDNNPESKELEDSKKELEKARQDLENAKKELKKTKSGLKTQKA